MTEIQFISRVLLTFMVGIIFIVVMTKLATRNSLSTTKAPFVLKILGGILVTLAILSGASAIVGWSILEHSNTTQEIITGIVRPRSSVLYWGYPTTSQNMVLSNFMSLFVISGYGIYFLKFRSSPVSWWKKTLKVISLILIMFLMYSSTNLHYFDWWELWPNILLIVIIYCNFKFAGKQSDTITESIAEPTEAHQNITTVIAEEKRNDDVIFETEDVEL